MERAGPFAGDPVPFNSVLAGRNAVAVDGVCLAAMGIPQRWVHYLTLASSKGLGPSNLAGIEVRGDSLKPRVFQLPDIPPTIDLPIANPATFQPSQGQITRVRYGVSRPSYTRIDVVKTSDLHSAVTQVRLLQDWTLRSAGHHVFEWDGRDSQGNLVEPGTYTVRVEATHGEVARNAFASSWVRVVDGASSSGVFQLEPSVLTFVGAVDSASPPAQTVIVNDFKGDALEWNVTSSSAWITLSPTSGTTPSAVTVEVSSVGLNAGVYMGEVTIVNAGTEAILQTVSVQFTVEPRTHKLLLPHALRP